MCSKKIGNSNHDIIHLYQINFQFSNTIKKIIIMKKITKILDAFKSVTTRKNFLLTGLLLLGFIFSVTKVSAIQYCQHTLTNGANSIQVSMESPVTNVYVITIESSVVMTGVHDGWWIGLSSGNVQAKTIGVLSNGGLTYTVTMSSTSVPNLYTQIHILYPGLVLYAWPPTITWGQCTTIVDTEAPTAFTATLGKELSTSVELLLNATDNSGAVSYQIVYGSTTINTSGLSGVQKSHTVTGLTPSTSYAFSVTAKDGGNNVAANSPIVVNATTTAGLTTSAPTPPAYSAAKVISIFSDAFTTVAGINYNPNWGQATQQSIIQVGTDNVLRYANFNYQGTTFNNVFPIATGMKYLHIDVWTETETSVKVFPICRNAANTGNEPEKFKTLTLAPTDLGTWKSFDIPLTDFTTQGLTMLNVYQLKLEGTGGKTVYFDNIYFYDDSADADIEAPTAFTATKGTVTADEVELLLNATDNSGAVVYTISYGTGPTVLNTSGLSGVEKSFIISGLTGSTIYNFSVVAKDAAGNEAANSPIVVNATTLAPLPASPTPSAAPSDVMSVFSDAYTPTATSLQYQSWWNASWSDIILANGGNAKKIITTGGTGGGGIQFDDLDISSMSNFHINIYPTDATVDKLQYNVVPVGGGGAGWTSFPTLIANQWNQINIPKSALGLPGTSVFQVGVGTFGGDGTFYIDNVLFSKDPIITSIGNSKDVPSIYCFPNPAIDKLTVSANSEISEVIVRNLVGQNVKSIIANGLEKSIDLSDVTSGNYLVTVKLANGQLSTQKFVKL